MMKRLLCLMLGLVMVLMVLTSCSDDGDAVESINDEASRFTKTLSMWVIAEEGMDPTQAAAVNEAINKITKQKFKTQVNIKYLTEAEYYTAVEKAFTDHEAALEEAKKNGTSLKSDITTQETILDEYGVPQLKYPEIRDFQVDILYVGNAVKYREYIEKEWIVALDGLMENVAVQLSYYVNGVLLDASKYNDTIFGVPNNTIIGDYTYLAVDEALANEYLSTPEDFGNSIFSDNCYDFLHYILERNEEGLYPIYSADGTVDLNLLHHWSFDPDGNYVLNPDQFSLFGGFYESTAVQGSSLGFANVLTSPAYSKNLQRKIEYEKTENFITTDPTARAAVRVVKGGWETGVALEAEGYKVLSVEAPRANDKEVFGSMYCIGSHSSDEERAMEIIAYLNTNSEFRNLLQYGIENENYTLHTVKGEGDAEYVYVKETETNKYKMDIEKTGNMFIAYPNSAANVLAWEFGKMQNLDAVAYPTTGLYFNLNDFKIDDKSIRVVNAVSAAFKASVLDQLDTPAAVAALCTGATAYTTNPNGMAQFLLAELAAKGVTTVTYTVGEMVNTVTEADLTAALACMASAAIVDGKDVLQSPNALYRDWLENSGVNA